MTSSDSKGNLHVTCLDAKRAVTTGTANSPPGRRVGTRTISLASAARAGRKNVYVAWSSPKNVVLVALTHDFQRRLATRILSFGGGHGFGSSPMVHDLRRDFALRGRMAGQSCAEADTGKDRWRVARKSRNTYATPILSTRPIRRADRRSYEDRRHESRSETGKLNWDAHLDKRHIEGAHRIASLLATRFSRPRRG